jgi:hypothetical protein
MHSRRQQPCECHGARRNDLMARKCRRDRRRRSASPAHLRPPSLFPRQRPPRFRQIRRASSRGQYLPRQVCQRRSAMTELLCSFPLPRLHLGTSCAPCYRDRRLLHGPKHQAGFSGHSRQCSAVKALGAGAMRRQVPKLILRHRARSSYAGLTTLLSAPNRRSVLRGSGRASRARSGAGDGHLPSSASGGFGRYIRSVP